MPLPTIDHEIAEIAARHLGIEHLEEQHSDTLDHHEIPVWDLRAALAEAYAAGVRSVHSSTSCEECGKDHPGGYNDCPAITKAGR